MRPYDEDLAPEGDVAEEEPPRRSRLLLSICGIVALLAMFGTGMWYAYNAGVQAGSDTGVPLIAAETGPVKVRPADPGGLEVPHQDVLIYDRFAAQQPKRPA